jgi:hypothetical protein
VKIETEDKTETVWFSRQLARRQDKQDSARANSIRSAAILPRSAGHSLQIDPENPLWTDSLQQKGKGDIPGEIFNFKHQPKSYKKICVLTSDVAKEIHIDPGPNRQFTAHSTRRMAITCSHQAGATERSQEKRHGFAAKSVAMRKYDTPDEDTLRAESNLYYGVGPRKPETAIVACQPQLKRARGPEDSEDTDLNEMLPSLDFSFDNHKFSEEDYAIMDRAASRHMKMSGPVRVKQAKKAHCTVIDLRGNTGALTFNFGSGDRPIVLD